ncbi:hypothetical protein ACN38_g13012 [Penicillium nordicum]|uniref:Uncharacterized protein n=1 Tax=Penicillium nordicum TaxID=229535 RepID=A0A0M8NXL4_9EURO|nr:hypothetical protein ACN38_g13012 [Penicillium nordicum]
MGPPLHNPLIGLYCRQRFIIQFYHNTATYDHRVWKTGLPVRSAVLKPHAGELVVGWVTTSESSLLYVFGFFIRSETSFCRPTLQPIQPAHTPEFPTCL